MEPSIIVRTDSYKVSQSVQYPPNTTLVKSYLESRGSDIADYTVFFGLQYYLKKYLQGVVVTEKAIKDASRFWDAHFGPGIFRPELWQHILDKHNGKLPVKIRSVPEGSIVPNHNVLMTIENTDPECYWLTNYLETLILKVWNPITVATHSRECKKDILKHLEKSGTPAEIDYKLHDFGFRGVSSEETAEISGASHLINFFGTDNAAGIWFIQNNYSEDPYEMYGHSIFASEHSTIVSWTKPGEIDAFRNILTRQPTGLVACVSDSFHILEAIDKWGELKELIMNRDGRLVVRPDSGDPARTDLAVIEKLGNIFGYTVNAKGYKVLDTHVRVIQGDGVNRSTINEIYNLLEANGWSSDNVGFGCGGKLLQAFNRDDFNFAIKACFVRVDGVDRFIEKSPVEINNEGELVASFKKSKKGDLKLVKTADAYKTVTSVDEGFESAVDELVTVFENGEILKEYSFRSIRETAKI